MKADQAEDVWVNNGRAYVANYRAGLRILDVSDPTQPREVGGVDSALSTCQSAVARDSFAYMGWADPPPKLRSIDVSDPSRPTVVGGCDPFERPQDMVLRDTLLYIAQRVRFQVVSVARPLEPRLVGSCVVGDATSAGLCLVDTLAYVTNVPTQVISVADPSSPRVVGAFNRTAWNVAVTDTFAYLAAGTRGLFIFSVADPTAPRKLDSLLLGQPIYDLELTGSIAYAGCENAVLVLSLADPVHPTVTGQQTLPQYAWRLHRAGEYLFAACADAGVVVLESTQVGVAEPESTTVRSPALRVVPNPARCRSLSLLGVSPKADVTVRDVTGRSRLVSASRSTPQGGVMLGLHGFCAGVYFVCVREPGVWASTKIVLE
jgi:hypothetical protein